MEERSQNSGSNRPENSAPNGGRNDQLNRGVVDAAQSHAAEGGRSSAELQRILSGYPNLQKLRRMIEADPQGRFAESSDAPSAELQEPITIAQLEMLEAELQNQGILPARKDRTKLLGQFANYEVDLWRWRARRVGSEAVEMHFAVDVPRYVVHCALNLLRRYEMPAAIESEGSNSISGAASGVIAATSGMIEISQSWLTHVSSDANLPANLLYLERFATYVLGGYGRALNRFQRGLNVVLRALGSPTPPADTMNSVGLTMPFSRPDFFRALKSVRER